MTSLAADTMAGRSTNHVLRAAIGMMIIVSVLLVGIGFYLSLAIAIYPQNDEGFEIVERGPYIHSYDPIALAELGLPPNSSNANALPANPEVRTISTYSDKVVLTAAGVITSSISLTNPITDLKQLKDLVNNPAWIEEGSAGVYTLKAALIAYSPSSFTIGSPQVREVQLLDMPSIFIGVQGGTFEFRDVTIRAVNAGQRSDNQYQPFVMATGGAKMTISNSIFSNLGWDWNASYGVSWVHGSTGSATGSVFEDSFIGVYTSRAERLSFISCIFRNNRLYGLDPHTYSRNLTIDNVIAERNGAHGIIFSDHVTDSVIKNSAAFANGENGIMMDQSSTYNVIESSAVHNNIGDGLVTAASSDNTFLRNSIYENRVGIRIDKSDAPNTVLTGNSLTRNNKASENAYLDGSNSIQDNGGQWNIQILSFIWFGVAMVLLIFGVLFSWIRIAHQGRRLWSPKLVENL